MCSACPVSPPCKMVLPLNKTYVDCRQPVRCAQVGCFIKSSCSIIDTSLHLSVVQSALHSASASCYVLHLLVWRLTLPTLDA